MSMRQRLARLEAELGSRGAGEVIVSEKENGDIEARYKDKRCTYKEYDADRILREFRAENIVFFKGAWELED